MKQLSPRSEPSPGIAAVVFAVSGPRHRQRVYVAILIAIVIHAAIVLWATHSERSLESWSAVVAARIHVELSREQMMELPRSPAPPTVAQAPPPPAPIVPKVRGPRRPPTEASKLPPPAQAGRIIAREENPNAPVDLTGETFVTGTANTYAGGVTSSTGTNPVAVQSRDVDPRSPPGQPDRSSPVALEDPDWRCPWPSEAEAEEINEQVAMVRAVVRADGMVESATILKDPGRGFGKAAVACTTQNRFVPARDPEGRSIRAQATIRVRFTR